MLCGFTCMFLFDLCSRYPAYYFCIPSDISVFLSPVWLRFWAVFFLSINPTCFDILFWLRSMTIVKNIPKTNANYSNSVDKIERGNKPEALCLIFLRGLATAPSHLSQLRRERLTQTGQWCVLDQITGYWASCSRPPEPNWINGLISKLQVSRATEGIWERKQMTTWGFFNTSLLHKHSGWWNLF